MDANIEIRQKAGNENFFLFGLTTEEVYDLKSKGYNPWDYYHNNPQLKETIDNSETQQSPDNVGFRSSTQPTCKTIGLMHKLWNNNRYSNDRVKHDCDRLFLEKQMLDKIILSSADNYFLMLK